MHSQVPSRFELLDRFRGAILGTAVGDCLGRPVEGRPQVDPAYLEAALTSPPALVHSDDTAMTVGLARSLLEVDGFDGDAMASRFTADYFADPYRGYGAGVHEIFTQVRQGVPWDEAAAAQFMGQGSYGNGAAMRVAPVALFAYPDLERTVTLAADTAAVTHTHPIGVDGAVAQAAAVHQALSAGPGPSDLALFVEQVRWRLRSTEMRDKLAALRDCVRSGDDDQARARLGNGIRADEAVPIALFCYHTSPGFVPTILKALGMGGDVDTIAAMAGALAGARYGASSIPEQWRRVEKATELRDLADELYERAVG